MKKLNVLDMVQGSIVLSALTGAIVVTAMMLPTMAKADTANYYLQAPESKPVTKLEAVRNAMNKKPVYKCNQVELTEKLTFKNFKKSEKSDNE